MWRFAVHTPKTTILSKTCLKTVRQALKHTDGRTDYFRFLSNDAAAIIRTDKDQPIRDVFSLDDFGLLSNKRSQSIESMSSTGDTFLEHLFRNDTLNTFSNVQIPTTMSSRELAVSNEILGYDYVSELLSEGAIPEEIAENLAIEPTTSENELSNSFSDSAMYHDDQEPSTSGLGTTSLPFLIPNLGVPATEEKTDTRKVMSEKFRRERKLNLSTTTPLEPSDEMSNHLFHIPEISGIQSVGEMLFPNSIPSESYTSQWKDREAFSVPMELPKPVSNTDYPIEFSLDVLEGIMTEGSMSELQKELKAVGGWPEWIFTGDRRLVSRTNAILRFVVENSDNYREAEEIIRNFSASHMKAVIPDDVVLHLTTKTVDSSSKIEEVLNQLRGFTTIAMTRELRPNHSLVEARLADLYNTSMKKFPKDAVTLFGLCSKLNLDRSADIFMKCYGATQADKNNFFKSFGEWKKLSIKYGTRQGIDSYWMAALNCEGAIEKRIEALLVHSGKTEHPFATVARMICTFVKLDKLAEALEVFRAVSVSGKHFKEPLASFVEKNDLGSIERLATLVERGMIAEKRRGSRLQATNKTGVEREKEHSLSDGIHAVLAKFYGVGGLKKKKFVINKLKKKIHRVDEEQLHDLCKILQKAWIQCAESKESIDRLIAWCQSNRIEIDEKIQKKISSFYK